MKSLATLKPFDFQEWKQKLQKQKPDMPVGVRLIDMHEVMRKTSKHRSTINRWVRDGVFPSGAVYGERSRLWLESEVDEWINKGRG